MHNITLETVVLIFVDCIVLSSLVLFVCIVFSLTSFMSDCRMTELWTYKMIYVCIAFIVLLVTLYLRCAEEHGILMLLCLFSHYPHYLRANICQLKIITDISQELCLHYHYIIHTRNAYLRFLQ